jgi:uncharacterized cupredoxin-like copper-binding protein
VTFIVKNAGRNPHERRGKPGNHAAMEHGDMGVRYGGIEVAPRQQSDSPGALMRAVKSCTGCHEPGHYEGGMVGRITVASA